MPANYDSASWFYDQLSRLVFGPAIKNSQLYLLPYIKINSNIIIIGGGTGWILEEIAKMHPSGLTITYVEVSRKMMSRSKKRFIAGNKVYFINRPIEHVDNLTPFDAIITPFLFDNFSNFTVEKIFAKLNGLLKPGGLWLYSDFQPGKKIWQKLMLKIMLLLFGWLCGVEATSLPEMDKKFKSLGYSEMVRQSFYKHFIVSILYSNNT